MKPLHPELDGIRQYDCYGNRTDSVTPIVEEGESLVILTEEDKILLAAALRIAASARYTALAAARRSDPDFVESTLDQVNTNINEDLIDLGTQFEGMLPSSENPIDQAIRLQLQALGIEQKLDIPR